MTSPFCFSIGAPATPEQGQRIARAKQGEFLHRASSRLRGSDVSLSRGDLVNEALVRLMQSSPDWATRGHFFATLSLTMRSVLCA